MNTNKETDMEPIYPLRDRKLSANQRLAPIFKALLDDSDGWVMECRVQRHGARWEPADYSALQAYVLNPAGVHIRLVPKRKTITVGMDEPNADPFIEMTTDNNVALLSIPFDNYGQAKAALNQIRKALEGEVWIGER